MLLMRGSRSDTSSPIRNFIFDLRISRAGVHLLFVVVLNVFAISSIFHLRNMIKYSVQ